MSTLIHLCKKDFAYAKPWVLGAWFVLAADAAMVAFMPGLVIGTDMMFPIIGLFRLLPWFMIFSTTARIIHVDPFVGTNRYMGTRPVSAATLFAGKLVFIAAFLIAPAVLFTLGRIIVTGLRPHPLDYLLVVLETGLLTSLIAAWAVMAAVVTRRTHSMAAIAIVGGLVVFWFVGKMDVRYSPFVAPLVDLHLATSGWLVTQLALLLFLLGASLSRALKSRISLTVAVVLLGFASIAAIAKRWTWNFADELSKEAEIAEIIADAPALGMLGEPTFSSNGNRRDTNYSAVKQPCRVTGLKDGWTGNLVKIRSEARFASGEIWQNESATPSWTPQFSGDLAGLAVARINGTTKPQRFFPNTLFEIETRKLDGVVDRKVSIQGKGTFQLMQPVTLAVLPARVGAASVSRRFRYRIDRIETTERQIGIVVSITSTGLRSRGDVTLVKPMELLLVNADTKESLASSGGGGESRLGSEWRVIQRSLDLEPPLGHAIQNLPEFIEGAQLHILGVKYGGNIDLPYAIPEMTLEEKH